MTRHDDCALIFLENVVLIYLNFTYFNYLLFINYLSDSDRWKLCGHAW